MKDKNNKVDFQDLSFWLKVIVVYAVVSFVNDMFNLLIIVFG